MSKFRAASTFTCMIMLIALIVSPVWAQASKDDVAKAVNGANQFAVDLYKNLASQEGNLLMSPYSVSGALAMTYAGARGETETEMADTLHFTLPQDRLHAAYGSVMKRLNGDDPDRAYSLNVANRLWGQKGYGFMPKFLTVTRENYGAELAQVDYGGAAEAARVEINRWVEEMTQEKIKDLIPSGVLDSLTRLVLTNAIYFKGDWKYQFDKKYTRDLPFTVSASERVDTPMMYQKAKFGYAEFPELQVLEMPYSGDELSMVVLLPKKVDGLSAIEEELTLEKIQGWTGRLWKRDVRVYLPRFKMTCQFGLNKTLADMGMPQAFSRTSDFSGMNGQRNLYISAVIHKAFIDVNEEGTEAAAATAVVMTLRSARPGPVIPMFRADHPFIFLLKDKQTDSILFVGRVEKPESGE